MAKPTQQQISYHTEEMKALRQFISQQVQSLDRMQYSFALATGAIYSFYLNQSQTRSASFVLLIPILLGFTGWLHYEGIRQDLIEIRRYISKIEESLAATDLGYAKYYIGIRSKNSIIRHARRAFWIGSIVFLAAFAAVSFCGAIK